MKRTTYQKTTRDTGATTLLTNQILDLIERMGGTARRVNTTGIPDGKGGMRTNPNKGFEDVDACIPVKLANGQKIGLKVAIEVKRGRDRQKDEQKLRQKELIAAGGIYLIAENFPQIREAITDAITQKIYPESK